MSSQPSLDRYFSTLHPLLEAFFEAIFVTNEKEIDSAHAISKSVMRHFIEVDGEVLKNLRIPQIQQVCIDLQRINKRLAFSNRQTLSDFHEFWRSLVLNLIRSESIEHKFFGLKQIVALIDSTHLPKSFLVSGAGCSYINGTYELTSSALDNGCISARSIVSYESVVPGDVPEVEARGKRLKLHPCLMTEAGDSFLSVWWFLSEETDDSESGVDYYFHKSNPHEQNRPPLSGWKPCGSAVDSPLTLEPQSEVIPIGERRNTLEQQLSKWIIQNKVFDVILGAQNNLMEAPTAMMKFLSRIHSGDDPVVDRSALNLVLGQKSRLLEPILPLLSEDSSQPAQQLSLTTSTQSSIAASSSSDFFTAIGAAKQRLASAERWRRSTQSAMQEYLLASQEVQNAHSYLVELERSREVISVDDVDSGDSGDDINGEMDRRRSKRHRRS